MSEKKEENAGAVNHPKHYNSHPSGIECIEVIQHYNDDIQELEKAKRFIDFEIERIKRFENK